MQLSSKSGTLMTSDGEILDENGNIITTTPGDATTASTPNETTSGEPTDNTLRQGVENERVTQVQERLMELGYMDNDEPTQLFGPATKNAVQLFQRKNSLDIDGCVGDETWNLLFSDQAQKYSVSEGITGTDVEQMQQRLVELGYLDHVTGYFGSDTTEAVKRFQERNNLTADGNIGENTRELLYSDKINAIIYVSFAILIATKLLYAVSMIQRCALPVSYTHLACPPSPRKQQRPKMRAWPSAAAGARRRFLRKPAG